jgi:predicted transcriptional regulator
MTLRNRIRRALTNRPGTATNLAHRLKASPASVSSVLKRMHTRGTVCRGVTDAQCASYRGGWVYYL